MSLAASRRVWSATPDPIRGGAFTLLLALADYADDRNLCWPTLPTLAQKARLGERQATDLLRQLEAAGQVLIARKPGRDGGMFFAVLTGLDGSEKVQTLHLFETEKVQFTTRKGAIYRKEKVQSLHEVETPFDALQSHETPLDTQCNDHKNDHERSESANAPQLAPLTAITEAAPTTTPQQVARPEQLVRSAAPPVEVEQPRLVDAAMPDPVDVYRQVAGVKKPTQAQREAIRRHVTSHPDLWREACDYFARNAYNVRKVDNLIDRYQKAVAEAQKLAAAAKRAEEERRRREDEREQPYATLEERRAIRDKLRRDWYNTAPAEPRPAMMARGRT